MRLPVSICRAAAGRRLAAGEASAPASGSVGRMAHKVDSGSPAKTRTPVRHRRRAIVAGITIVAIVGFVYFVVPQISGLSATLKRLRSADLSWIGVGVVLESLSLAGYIWLFRDVFSTEGVQIGWRESFEINMAGTVATKLLATAGAGGVALSVWALRASGLKPAVITRRLVTFELLLYAVFALAILVVGAGLRAGVFSGEAPWTLTVVPAAVAGGLIVVVLALGALPGDFEQRIARLAGRRRRAQRVVSRLASVPGAVRDAVRIMGQLVRERRFGLLGGIAYWGFDIATLWACLRAFGSPPPVSVVVMAYFVGQLMNVLPIPGGVGGVEGGTIGALIAFGTQGSLAVLGVLSYRLISFWLPTAPGAFAYLRLRRTVARWRAE